MPFYNEGSRPLKVLAKLIKVKSLDEIICVDDGSTDSTSNEIKKLYPQTNLIIAPKNLGKAGAIKLGLAEAKGEYILLFDADLSNINSSEIEKAIGAVIQNPKIDLIILRRINDPTTAQIYGRAIIASGERILRKSDLTNILDNHVFGYQIEVAINQYMIDNKKICYWMPNSATNIWKKYKYGFIKGQWKDLLMDISITKFIGPIKYFKQLSTFCRREYRFD